MHVTAKLAEAVVNASSITIAPEKGTVPKPLGLSNMATAGGACGIQRALVSDARVSPVKESIGTNNIGLLVTIWGKVTKVYDPDGSFSGYFYIDDGFGLYDGSGDDVTGIRCALPADESGYVMFPLPLEGTYVAVTGVMGAEMVIDPVTNDPISNIRYLRTTSVQTIAE